MADQIEYKTRGELQAMRAAGLILARALDAARTAIAPGVTTSDLDAVVDAVFTEAGAVSNFRGYHGYPAAICASVNDEIVHGIPSKERILVEGDLVSIDAGCSWDGWHADSAFSAHVGEPPSMDEVDLIAAAHDAMWAGIAAIRAGGRLGDVSWAVETSVLLSARQDGRRYGSVNGYGGHGIGSAMHMDPFVPNQGRRNKGLRLAGGMALAIEPMLTLGRAQTRELDDGWTVVTRDGSRAAHVEHSVAITDEGISVLTAPDRGVAGLEQYGIAPVDLD